MKRPVVLASSSPRRKDLLEKAGLEFVVDPSEMDEKLDVSGGPEELARAVSLGKARAAAQRHPDAVIIAADTFGVLERKLLGKPVDAADARRMLRLMSGKHHDVLTGFTVMDSASGKSISRAVKTRVYFKRLTDARINEYVATGEPLDKAGAYGIQGLGGALVERIEGDYHNVIGLPLKALAKELKQFGIDLPHVPQSEWAADSPAR